MPSVWPDDYPPSAAERCVDQTSAAPRAWCGHCGSRLDAQAVSNTALRAVINDLRRALQEAVGVAKRLDEQRLFTGRIGGWYDLALRAEKLGVNDEP